MTPFEALLRDAGYLPDPKAILAVLERLHKVESELATLKVELGRARVSRRILAEELAKVRAAFEKHVLPAVCKPPSVRGK